MKKSFLSILFVITAFFAYSQTSVKIINSTSDDLYGVYTSGTEGDLLPEDILQAGYEVEIVYPEGYDCEVAVTISYDNDGTEEVAYEFEINICEVSVLDVYDEYYILDGEKFSYDE